LICHTICQYLKKHEVDKLRRTCRTFLEVGDYILRDINVLATCGLYTNRSSYYAGSLETPINNFTSIKEYETHYSFKCCDVESLFIKNGVDHVLFGDCIGIIKHDHIEILFSCFSYRTLRDEPWDPLSKINDIVHLDDATKKYLVDKDLPLRQALFKEAVYAYDYVGRGLKKLDNKWCSFSKIDGGVLITVEDAVTIEVLLIWARRLKFVYRITFDGRLTFY